MNKVNNNKVTQYDDKKLSEVAESIRELTVGSTFRFEEFVGWVKMEKNEAAGLLQGLLGFAYVKQVPMKLVKGGFLLQVTTKEERKDILKKSLVNLRQTYNHQARLIAFYEKLLK